MTARPVGIGILGATSFIARRAVVPAVGAADGAAVVAVASRSSDVSDEWGARAVPDYDDVIAHPDVEAVYLPLPNGMHAHWSERCAERGKHVLCEKPLARSATEAASMASLCRSRGVLLAEAWMTPFDPRFARVVELAREGAIGSLKRVEGTFTFTIGTDQVDNYRWQPQQGGGALADVGIYCLGAATGLFGPDARVTTATQVMTPSGVDARTDAELRWPNGATAAVCTSFVDDEVQHLAIIGSQGELHLDGDAFTGGASATDITDARGATVESVRPDDCYRRMIEAFASAVRGSGEWPRPVERSVEMMTIIDEIGRAAGAPDAR